MQKKHENCKTQVYLLGLPFIQVGLLVHYAVS